LPEGQSAWEPYKQNDALSFFPPGQIFITVLMLFIPLPLALMG
jgi:hypothetical protein